MKKKALKKIIENSISNSLNYRNDKYDKYEVIGEKNSYNDFIFTNSSDETNQIDTIGNLSNYNLFNYKLYIQAVNYNVLRFIGGIVGVAFTY